jgi:hypothetical protein
VFPSRLIHSFTKGDDEQTELAGTSAVEEVFGDRLIRLGDAVLPEDPTPARLTRR